MMLPFIGKCKYKIYTQYGILDIITNFNKLETYSSIEFHMNDD